MVMKSFLVLLVLLITAPALADEPKEMYMPNDAGGFLTLTSEPCTLVGADKVSYPYRAYATESSELAIHEGCWSRYTDDSVYATFAESMVNTWWGPGLMANFRQKLFSPEKKRLPEQARPIDIKLQPIEVRP
jgi:hypothetical protein